MRLAFIARAIEGFMEATFSNAKRVRDADVATFAWQSSRVMGMFPEVSDP
jgi:hypothetical protein